MNAEAHQSHIDHLKQKFIDTAFLKDGDREKGYVVAESFNLVIDPEVLEIASKAWATYFEGRDIDAVVGLADAGSRLAPVLAGMLKVKMLPSKRTPNVPGAWRNVVSYSNHSFTLGAEITSHIGFVEPGMNLLLVDDVIAHGPTSIAAIQALQKAEVNIVGLAIMFDKVSQGGVAAVTEKTGIDICSLITILGFSEDNKIILK